jgi:hypothetical protein
MGTQQGLFLKALIERFPNPALHAVLEAAPEEFVAKFRTLPDTAGIAPEMVWKSSRILLLSIHPSWHEEILEHCPQVLQPVLRNVLCDAQQHRFDIKNPMTLFLLDYLISQWSDKDIQGLAAIEGTPLQWMADCTEQQLDKIAELLAVYDVADIIRHIVDKKILQNILQPFSSLQQRYLRTLLRRPAHSVTLNKDLLSLIRDDPEKAKKHLAQRGLERFGQALKDAPPSLLWHVLHHIDRQAAQAVSNIMSRSASDIELARARKSAIHAYEFLKRTEIL